MWEPSTGSTVAFIQKYAKRFHDFSTLLFFQIIKKARDYVYTGGLVGTYSKIEGTDLAGVLHF